MLDALLPIALDLTASLSAQDRYQRLVQAVRRVVPCDAAALLRYQEGGFRVLAAVGLVPDALGRAYDPGVHPRLAALVGAAGPVRFAAADPRPDPFDGLIAGRPGQPSGVHSCLGCPLRVEGDLVGLLTVDALGPGAFDQVEDERITAFAALAGAALRTAALFEALEAVAERRGQVARKLVAEALQRGGGEILGQSPGICALRQEVERVAASDLAVMVLGETGTGKELVARTLHARSARADQPLVYVNCAALPESIAESELWGPRGGTENGGGAHRRGRFELASGGTLFLDEVGELPLSIQPKLLRALQAGEVQRVGADRVLQVDVRLIAATNRELSEEVRAGRFRADLYHRLMVYPVRVPPLRERGEDVLLLAGHFLDEARLRLGTGPVRLTAAAREALRSYDWPGNVRELEHVALRAVIRAAEGRRGAPVQVDAGHLDTGPVAWRAAAPEPTPAPAAPAVPLSQAVADFERRYIWAAVEASGGNWAAAARSLGTDRANLHRLGRRLGLKD
ncbi:MAG: nitric oxide reductase transcriptional regulator NorR [Candidatus Latescibacterota bacterium]